MAACKGVIDHRLPPTTTASRRCTRKRPSKPTVHSAPGSSSSWLIDSRSYSQRPRTDQCLIRTWALSALRTTQMGNARTRMALLRLGPFSSPLAM
ncbi:hypothetical protein OH76DRAFT_196522 [Lentinus brumalis]|uniref:Uncharacterized protein n=1 Tax=Lentinus brumalis TaxID=2498619 RepID=A0A371DI17_9APHY|nr:hypothetical protein OH76DRAFT_196522 [Polyporus brumalis]